MDEREIIDLLDRIRKGDTAAAGELCRILHKMMLGRARAVLGPIAAQDAEDVVQKACMTILRRLPDWRGLPQFLSYVLTAVVRAAIDYLRVNAPQEELIDEKQEDVSAGPPADPIQGRVIGQAMRLVLQDTAAPQETLCYVANKFLDDDTEALEMDSTLEQFLDELVERCIDLHLAGMTRAKWEQFFAPLRARMAEPAGGDKYTGKPGLRIGQTQLAHYQGRISHWILSVHRRFISKAHEGEEEFLTLAFGRALPHKALVFARMELLQERADDLYWHSSKPLRWLADDLLKKFSEITTLARRRVNACFGILDKKLKKGESIWRRGALYWYRGI